MSCVVYLLGSFVVCAFLISTNRVKLKARYGFTLIAATVLLLVYFQFPVCGNPVFPLENNLEEKLLPGLESNVILQKELSHVNERELSDVLEPNQATSKHHIISTIPSFAPNQFDEGELIEENYDKEETKITNLDDGVDNNENKQTDDDEYEENYDEITEERESPKYNGSDAAPKPSRNVLQNFRKKDNFLYQNNMAKDEKAKYFFDRFSDKSLLPHFSSNQAKIKHRHKLPWWEKNEIENFPRVWYVGELASKKIILNQSNPYNFGFDYLRKRDGGIYRIVKGDHLEYRYEILEKLGRGSYGIVVRVRDHALPVTDPQHLVAVKIMHNDSSTEKYFKLELDLMEMIRSKTDGSEYFPVVLRTFFFRNHFCIVMELLGSTLEETRNDQPVQDLKLLRKYTFDILNGLSVLHKADIIHGDLKPENLMLARNSTISSPILVKVVDFSLSCIPDSLDLKCPGTHFQTRLYRAPEVVMNLDYTVTADMWSLGVILAELYTNKIPFYGETNTDQLAAIMEVMGLIPPYMVETSPDIDTYQSAVCYKCKNGFERVPYRKSLSKILENIPEDLYDFIRKCFELDYKKRMTSSEALHHPFVASHVNKAIT